MRKNFAGVAGTFSRFGTVIALTGMIAGPPFSTALAGDSRSEIAVSAYVIAASSVTVNVADASDASLDGASTRSAAKAANAQSTAPSKSMCAAIAVSCTSKAPMRVSVDGNADSVNGFEQCAATPGSQQGPQHGPQKTLSLCAAPENDSGRFGITIEY